ncbi:MAG: GxxExxY protein [Bacillota bacterium]
MKERTREFLLKDETYAVVGAAMEVYNTLGPGFLEAVYQEALEVEFTERGIPFESQKPIMICYKNHLLQKHYIADVVCYGALLTELKAIENLTPREESQLINYMKATGLRVGLLLNFGHPKNLDWKRMIL